MHTAEYDTNKKFQHLHSAHCETGVMASMLSNSGLTMSEPMALGLSASIAFAFLPMIKLNGLPLIAYRMPPKTVIKGLQKRAAVRMKFKTFRSSEKGMDELDRQIEMGKLVGLQTSVYWLPYFPDEMRFHFNAHNLLVYGRDGDDYLISDPVFESVVRCGRADLQKARFAKGALAPKGMMYTAEQLPAVIDYERQIPLAIARSARTMAAPLPIIGIKGIHFLANKLAKLDRKLKDPHKIKLFIGHIVRMQEEIGTGGAGFRFIYAAFLQEAADLLANPVLQEASEMMTEVGDGWRLFALNCAKMCKNRSSLDLKYLSQLLHQCADEEQKVWQLLRAAI